MSSSRTPVGRRFTTELHGLLGRRLASPILHVGSTSVPGLPAKPIIDLQALAVEPAQVVDGCRDELVSMHWHVVSQVLDQRPWRWFVVRSDASGKQRFAHLHLMTVDEPRWHQ